MVSKQQKITILNLNEQEMMQDLMASAVSYADNVCLTQDR